MSGLYPLLLDRAASYLRGNPREEGSEEASEDNSRTPFIVGQELVSVLILGLGAALSTSPESVRLKRLAVAAVVSPLTYLACRALGLLCMGVRHDQVDLYAHSSSAERSERVSQEGLQMLSLGLGRQQPVDEDTAPQIVNGLVNRACQFLDEPQAV